nr:MAG TPA: hypothetical protein [Caudoviricetes sp.]
MSAVAFQICKARLPAQKCATNNRRGCPFFWTPPSTRSNLRWFIGGTKLSV